MSQKVIITPGSDESTLHLKISRNTEHQLCVAYTSEELNAAGALVEQLLNGLSQYRINQHRSINDMPQQQQNP